MAMVEPAGAVASMRVNGPQLTWSSWISPSPDGSGGAADRMRTDGRQLRKVSMRSCATR